MTMEEQPDSTYAREQMEDREAKKKRKPRRPIYNTD